MKYNLLKETNERSVIYQHDPDNPNNPEVVVPGVGRYKLRSLEKYVREKIADLQRKVTRTRNYDDWKQVKWMLEHDATREMVETIVHARKEIEGVKEAFTFKNSKRQDLLGKIERLAQLVKNREAELHDANERIQQLEKELERYQRMSQRDARIKRAGSWL